MPSSDQILTQNDHSRSFKVIRFGVNVEPLRGYIVQYNNGGLKCEGSEDITRIPGLQFCRWQYIVSSSNFRTVLSESQKRQESSAKLTNQRVNYAFTYSPFSFHACHILPTSKFQYSYSCVYLFTTDISEQHVWELWLSVNTVHWFDASSLGDTNE